MDWKGKRVHREILTTQESLDYQTYIQDVNLQGELQHQGQELLTLVLQNKAPTQKFELETGTKDPSTKHKLATAKTRENLPTMARLQVPPPEGACVRATPEQDLRDPTLPPS